MTAPVWWEAGASDGPARSGTLHTPHGDVPTPAFMAVGTRGTVRGVGAEDLESLGADIVLANTYHLMLRPGAEVVAGLGEIHGFMAWQRPILTDSGGFQVFSLDPDVDEEGVRFRSSYDGSPVALTPEGAVAVQESLGSDIAMMLDVLVGLPSSRAVVTAAMERTLRWAARALAAKRRDDRALFGIVQGGVDPELRRRSAEETAALGFPGFGIGGLAVGEDPGERNAAIDVVTSVLPADAPRYVMGLGDTEGLLDAVARGCDLFDCVIPTRLARHGKVLASRWGLLHQAGRVDQLGGSHRSRLPMRHVSSVHPRLSPPPVRDEGTARTPPAEPAQPALHARSRRIDARCDWGGVVQPTACTTPRPAARTFRCDGGMSAAVPEPPLTWRSLDAV